jgi:hypothetical protein
MDQACAKCSAAIAPDETFCSACGEPIGRVSGGVYQDPPPQNRTSPIEAEAAMRRARKWLLAISILTLITGAILFAVGKNNVEDQIQQAERATAHLDPEVRDARFKAATGMTFDEAVAHDRGQVNLLLVVNIGLAAFYLGMWFWAKRNARAATVTALLMFVTTIVVNAVLEPNTLYQGIIVKILFIVALAKAISVAREAPRTG